MDIHANHLVISEISNIHNIHLSDDGGESWQEAQVGSPMITDLKFNFDGDLYGVFPGYSNSSGLWRSSDWGNTWEVEFWSDNMSAVGFDAMSIAFVGWESPTSSNEGIAIYTPNSIPPNLSPLNEGLPNLNINKILMNPTMSAIAIFCCTDAGVYSCYDYMVGVEDLNEVEANIKLFPNPASNTDQIWIETSANIKELNIYTFYGALISSWDWDQNSQQYSFDIKELNLDTGTYLIRVITDQNEFTEKLIIY